MNMDIEEDAEEKKKNSEARKKKKDGKVDEQTQYYSRNYKRFLE